MLGLCDVVVAELCRRAGWDLRHEMVPLGQRAAVERVEGFDSRWSFRVVDPGSDGLLRDGADALVKSDGDAQVKFEESAALS